LTPDDYLIGPREAWAYHTGVWGGSYEAVEVVDRRQAPFALWQGPAFVDGSVRGRLKLHKASELAVLLIRAQPTRTTWEGYAIELDPRGGTVSLTRRTRSADRVCSATTELPTNVWHPFRLNIDGKRLQFWLGDLTTPLIDFTDDQVVEPGRFGVGTWGAPLSLDELSIEAGGSRWDLARFFPTTQPASRNVFPGWTRCGGQWTRSAGGSWTVGKDDGARVVWDEAQIANGEISVGMRLSPGQAFKGGVIFRVRHTKAGADDWSGYETGLDLGRQTVFIGDQRDVWTNRAEGPCKVEPGRWHHLRVVLDGPRIQVFVDGAEKPQVEYVDPSPLPGGSIGLRTWASEIAYRNLTVRKDGKTVIADFRAPSIEQPTGTSDEQRARQQALQSLCLVVLNLNEFVYVD
jgi:hypothetical protein